MSIGEGVETQSVKTEDYYSSLDIFKNIHLKIFTLDINTRYPTFA